MPSAAIEQLVAASERIGSQSLLARLSTIVVPLSAAMTVFTTRTLPAVVARTRSLYPAVDRLSPARRTALVSLVYNRGASLSDRNPALEDRREMRTIRQLLAAAQDDLVADQIDAMTRLWDPATLPGLIQRRRDEAKLWRQGFSAVQLD